LPRFFSPFYVTSCENANGWDLSAINRYSTPPAEPFDALNDAFTPKWGWRCFLCVVPHCIWRFDISFVRATKKESAVKAKLAVSLGFFISAVAIGVGMASAASTSVDYFTEVTTTGPPNVNTDTGQLEFPSATGTNPATSLYYDSGCGCYTNTSGEELISQGGATGEADLSNGQLHAAGGATSLADSGSTYGFPASATASMGDVLYFTNPGAATNTQTTVDFELNVDGTMSCFLGGAACDQTFGAGLGDASVGLYIGDMPAMGAWAPTAENVSQSYYGAMNWYGTGIDINYNMAGSFTFTGPDAVVPIWMELYAAGQYANADFSNTASFSFTNIPEGVSFASASGAFLTGSVPEPSAWAMMLIGFTGLAFVGYRRRWVASSVA
jgi:hypothetical protein